MYKKLEPLNNFPLVASSDGPSNTTMTIMPMRSTYITGSNITLSCSADSIPPAIIQWMVDGMYLNQSGPQLQLQMVKESNSGNYQCLFYNTVTLLFSSKSAMINILGTVGNFLTYLILFLSANTFK